MVALYFYEEGVTSFRLTKDIKTVYEELAQRQNTFEVVLIYLYDTYDTFYNTSEESFCNTFKTMPWLALPFKDPKCRDLKRLFHFPEYSKFSIETAPTLVIVGPHGEFVEPWGADILSTFKLPAYTFTREKVAKLDTEKVKDLKLEMLWDQNTLFRKKDGFKVSSLNTFFKCFKLSFFVYKLQTSGKWTLVHFLSGYKIKLNILTY